MTVPALFEYILTRLSAQIFGQFLGERRWVEKTGGYFVIAEKVF